ncbi:MAG: efflux RND transporter periplasmic adaptor subunit [Blastocatellales bacterium]
MPEEKNESMDHKPERNQENADNGLPRVVRPQKAWKWASFAGALFAAAFAAWWFWSGPQTVDQAAETAVAVSVRVAKVERKTIAAQAAALGTVFPREQATVSAKISSQIKQMALLKNRMVKAGDVIAVLESHDLQAQRAEAEHALRQATLNLEGLKTGTIPQAGAQEEKTLRDARANVTTARAQYERRRELYTKGGIAEKDLEAARLALTLAEDELRLSENNARLRALSISPNQVALATVQIEQARQRLAALDAQLGYATIRAPISGIITEQFTYEGEFAMPGAKLVTIADLSEVIVKAQFADNVIIELDKGDTAMIEPQDVQGEQMTGTVSLVSRANDPLNRTVEVWISLKNPGGRLRAGDAVRTIVTRKQEMDAVVVPTTAVTLDASNSDQGTVMTVGKDSVAREVKVTTGIRTTELIQIVSGVQPGETVIIEGNYALPDGTKVQVAKSKGEATGEAGGKTP